MFLYLVQHGKALSKEEDPERPLSDEGVADVEKVASFLGGMRLERIFHSGKLRARQTAEIFGKHTGSAVSSEEGLSPLDEPSVWADRLKEADGDTMLVGHLPHMGRLASLLLCGDSEAQAVDFSMGGVLCLWHEEGGWAVRWMVVPDIIK